MDPQTVQFTPAGAMPETAFASAVLAAAGRCAGDPSPILDALRAETGTPPLPGHGETAALWQLLASVAALDLTAARTLEPHLDAAAILDQAGVGWEPGIMWGVFAAEGPGARLDAVEGHDDGSWLLSGDKPWCSLAGSLDSAVITATVPDGRRAFALDLRQAGVVPVPGTWASHGLSGVPSGPVRFDDAVAHPVGETGWYLQREGFAWGSLAVASCWFGGAVGLFRSLHAAAGRRKPDQLALAWLGEADRLLASGASLLADAARSVDTGRVGWRQAHRVRGHIASLCERMLAICGQAMGPGPLAFDAEHARRVSDLQVYIRQHHAARDDAALGRLLVEDSGAGPAGGTCPW
ncbi:acyl-CoA dehydrogenase [Arthrobacter sp. JSM 101049]|uniref:acyl-CoA dehydrogenase n=1 Tax=Arthrobacter sp. JSM 101049 TaxID=929097 RepID=UPI0035617C17